MKRYVTILCLLCMAYSTTAFGQILSWSPGTGPYSSSVNSVVSFHDTLYAAVSSGLGQGLYHSVDGGNSWALITAGITNDVEISAAHTLFAAGSSGVLASINAGATWAVRDTGLPLFATAYAIKYINNVLYVCLGSDGFYKSTDDGKSWKVPDPSASGIVAHTVFGYANSIIVGEEAGTMLSTNRGVSWSEPINELTGIAVHAFFGIGTQIFAGTDNGVFVSSNGGVSWSNSSLGIPSDVAIGSITVSADGKTMFAGALSGSLQGLYGSDDNGKTWHFLYNNIWGYSINSLAVTSFGILAGTDICVFKSTDNGVSWKSSSQGFTEANVTALVTNVRLFAGTVGSNILSTDDMGGHWHSLKQGLTRPNIRALLVTGTTILAGTDAAPKLQKGGIYRSTDNGATWSLTKGVPFIGINAFLDNGSALFAGADSGIYSSTDNGMNWSFSGSGITDTVFALGESGQYLYAGTKLGLFTSTDHGNSWSKATGTGLGKKTVHAFTSAGTEAYIGTDSGVYHSSENYPWSRVSGDSINVLSMWSNGNIIAAGTTKGIYLSTNLGSTWQFQTSAGAVAISAITSDNKNIYAGTSTGVLQAPIGQFAGVASIPKNDLTLEATNPSGNAVIIRYAVPESGNISLKIYDLQGKEITVFTEYQNSDEITWNTSSIANGTYIIQLVSNGQRKSFKITIVK